jgi:hypothetical protein
MKLIPIILGGIKRAFTSSGGSLATVSSEANVYDPQAYVALFLRGLVAIALAWLALQLGVPAPDITTL